MSALTYMWRSSIGRKGSHTEAPGSRFGDPKRILRVSGFAALAIYRTGVLLVMTALGTAGLIAFLPSARDFVAWF